MQALRTLSSTPILPPRNPFPSCPTKDFSNERSDLVRHRLQPRRLFADHKAIKEEEAKPPQDEELDYDTTSSTEKVSEDESHNKREHSEEKEHHSIAMIRPESEKERLFAIRTDHNERVFFVQPFTKLPMIMEIKFPPKMYQIIDLQERGLTNAEDLLDKEKFIRMCEYYELPTLKRVDLLVQLAYHRLEKIVKRMDLHEDQLDHLPDIDQ